MSECLVVAVRHAFVVGFARLLLCEVREGTEVDAAVMRRLSVKWRGCV